MQLTKQTIRTAIRWRYLDLLDWFDRQNPNLVGLLIAALLGAGLVGTIVQIRSAPSAAAVPTASLPGPIIIIATPAPAVPLVAPAQPAQQVAAAPMGNVTKRALIAYSSPDTGSAIGAVEPGRAFTPVAH